MTHLALKRVPQPLAGTDVWPVTALNRLNMLASA